jgi:hypothetical protein
MQDWVFRLWVQEFIARLYSFAPLRRSQSGPFKNCLFVEQKDRQKDKQSLRIFVKLK